MADKRVLVMNGPNLNLLGMREPGVYGDESYDAICARVEEQARALGLQADFFQSTARARSSTGCTPPWAYTTASC